MIPLKTPTDSYVTRYPQFNEIADTQIEKCFWTHGEIKVDKDIQDLRVNCTEQETHGVISVLKLFVNYERRVGDYWLTKVYNNYPVPEVQRMASCFGNIETNVHAPFYNKINDVMGLATDKFYTEYVDDPILLERVKWMGEIVGHKDDAMSVAGYSMVEGAVLYSNFAFLKHFQNNGKNRMMNVVRGINQSAIDENLHSIGGSMLFQTQMGEEQRSEQEMKYLHEGIRHMANSVYEHESRIAAMIFEKGSIVGITHHQIDEFVKSRINICLDNLGVERMFEVKYNPIASWFYDALNKYQLNDFFTGIGREYTRDWDEDGFDVWGNAQQ